MCIQLVLQLLDENCDFFLFSSALTIPVSVRVTRRVGRRCQWTIVYVQKDCTLKNIFERFNQEDTLKIARVRVGKEAKSKVFYTIRDYQSMKIGDVVTTHGNHIEFQVDDITCSKYTN